MDGGSARARRPLWQRPFMLVILTVVIALVWNLCVVAAISHIVFNFPPPPPPAITVIGRDCGHMLESEDFMFYGGKAYDPDEGEQCLWRAYRACQTSTLLVDYVGIDFGSTGAYTVRRSASASGCAMSVALAWSNQTVFGWVATGATDVCASMVQQVTGGLYITSCSGGSGGYLLLPRPAEQVGHVCGVLVGDARSVASVAPWELPAPSVANAEACFWGAYQGCAQPATLIYDHVIPSTYPDGSTEYTSAQHTLVVEPARGGCLVTDAASAPMPGGTGNYTCASLSRAADGSLIATGCGAEGEITIPSKVSATSGS